MRFSNIQLLPALWVMTSYSADASTPSRSPSAIASAAAAMPASITAKAPMATATDGALGGRINYIRNSVKATVDAYDGKVTLYAWDDQDPVLQRWTAVVQAGVPLGEHHLVQVGPVHDEPGAALRHRLVELTHEPTVRPQLPGQPGGRLAYSLKTATPAARTPASPGRPSLRASA